MCGSATPSLNDISSSTFAFTSMLGWISAVSAETEDMAQSFPEPSPLADPNTKSDQNLHGEG